MAKRHHISILLIRVCKVLFPNEKNLSLSAEKSLLRIGTFLEDFVNNYHGEYG